MKKKLQLKTILKLKIDLEQSIIEYDFEIVKYDGRADMKVTSLLETLKTLQTQLLSLKETIQTANRAKGKDGKTNNYYIFHLSNLKRLKEVYSNLDSNDRDTSEFSDDDIDEFIRQNGKEIEETKEKLKDFNNKVISVELNEEIKTMIASSKAWENIQYYTLFKAQGGCGVKFITPFYMELLIGRGYLRLDLE